MMSVIKNFNDYFPIPSTNSKCKNKYDWFYLSIVIFKWIVNWRLFFQYDGSEQALGDGYFTYCVRETRIHA